MAVSAVDLTDEGQEADWSHPHLQSEPRQPLLRVVDKFEDRGHYASVFSAFLDQEMKEEQAKREYLGNCTYQIMWSPGGGYTAAVRLPAISDLSMRDQLLVADPNEVAYRFRISKIDAKTTSVYLRAIGDLEGFLISNEAIYSVRFYATQVHLRMKMGLKQFEYGGKISEALVRAVIGVEIPPEYPEVDIELPATVHLNGSQMEAVRFAMRNPLALIQGPPGTGKTSTAAAIIYNFVRVTRRKVLVCAPSNVAVDHLTLSLKPYTDIKPLRIYSRTVVQSENILLVEKSALHWEVRNRLARHYPQFASDILRRDSDLEAISEIPSSSIQRIEKSLIEESHVVCCTCASSTAQLIREVEFGAVILDEAGYATEPDSLLPMLVGAERFVMLGDEQQLPPFVQSKTAISLGFGKSMFERLGKIGIPRRQITIQYRMHPDLSQFSNAEIYKNRLADGVQAADRSEPGLESFWGGPHPLIFYNVTGVEEQESAWSYRNAKEAILVEELLYRITQLGVTSDRIGVITAYDGQRKYVLEVLARKRRVPMEDLEVKNVDGFQGREKDYIFYSCVRANMESELGFLHSRNRLNVSITRARFGLVIVGNCAVLNSNVLFRKLITKFAGIKQLKSGDEILRSIGE